MPQTINNPPAMARVRSLGQKYPQQKGKATHTSILAWRIAWTEEPSGLQSMGPQRVRHSVLFFFPFVFCMTNNVTFEFRTKVGKIISRASRDPGESVLQTVPAASPALGLALVGTLLPLGQVGQSRSLPVSWRTEEAPPLWGHWHFLAPRADAQEWGCRLFIAFGHRTSGHLNLSVSSCAQTHF